jgi:hypothetical protein
MEQVGRVFLREVRKREARLVRQREAHPLEGDPELGPRAEVGVVRALGIGVVGRGVTRLAEARLRSCAQVEDVGRRCRQ